MLFFSTPSSLFLTTTTLLLSSPACAAPTRANCHCTILSAQNTPSTPQSMPSDSSPPSLSTAADICAHLGPELGALRDSEPELYDAYIRQAEANSNARLTARIPTSLLLAVAARGSEARQREEEGEEGQRHGDVSRDALQPQETIVCRSEPWQEIDAYQDLLPNLWVSQIIIAVAILACVAEGIHLAIRWISNRYSTSAPTPSSPQNHRLHLPGGEKALLAIPPTNPSLDKLASPGSEKKSRAYETMRFDVRQSSTGPRQFIAYDDEDDDEMNRPVM